MGKKMGCFGQLRPTRSRQDEPIEAREVGANFASNSGFLFAGGPFPFGPAAAALLARPSLFLAGPPEPPDFHFCEQNAEVIDARQPKKNAQVGR
jgi:hypothetical protein